jgi:hypothetical protein
MKKLIDSMAVATAIMLCFTACKKNNEQTPQTVLQKIQAKWHVQSIYQNDHFSGTDHIQNSTGGPGDYIEFRGDGMVYSSVFGFTDTSTYVLSGDTKILLNGSGGAVYDIKTLTANNFVLYEYDVSGPDFLEEKITMTK